MKKNNNNKKKKKRKNNKKKNNKKKRKNMAEDLDELISASGDAARPRRTTSRPPMVKVGRHDDAVLGNSADKQMTVEVFH